MLSITELTKQYATGTRALESVTLNIDEPQVVAVIGSSGAGKSTLIRCVNRLVEPTSGRIVLHRSTSKRSFTSWSRKAGSGRFRSFAIY